MLNHITPVLLGTAELSTASDRGWGETRRAARQINTHAGVAEGRRITRIAVATA